MPALLPPDTYTQKLLLPHFIPHPQREPLRHAVILRVTYVPGSSHRHLAFYLQRHSAIFLLSLALKNSLSSFTSPMFSQSCCFYPDWPKHFHSLPLSAQMCQPGWALWAAVCSPQQSYEPALSRSQNLHFPFLFFYFNGQYFASLGVCGIWTFSTDVCENPQIESTKEVFCSFHSLAPWAGTGCWEIPWLHSRESQSLHISDLPQHNISMSFY